MKAYSILVVFCSTLGLCISQEIRNEFTYSMVISGIEQFHLHNLNGKVEVRAVDGKTATLTVERTLTSGSKTTLEEAKDQIYVDSMMVDGRAYWFMQHPHQEFRLDEEGHGYYHSDWNWNGNRRRNDRFDIKYQFKMVLELPRNIDLSVSTHREDLLIDGLNSDVFAQNHHGSVTLRNIGGNASVHTHHGSIKVDYTRNPDQAGTYHTHHGDISVKYLEGFSADVSLKSHHGEFFTDFDWTAAPANAQVSESDGQTRVGTKYAIKSDGRTFVTIGNGGLEQSFSTHHGSIYLLKR